MAELKIPTEEELKKLSPAERIKRLKQLEESRKRELEDAKKQIERELSDKEREVQEQIAATEELIKQTEQQSDREEIDEAMREAQRRRDEAGREEESLEERIGQERGQAREEPARAQYSQDLYSTLERANERLDELGRKESWNEYDVHMYRETRAQLERAQTYTLSTQLKEDLGSAFNHLYKMKENR